MEAGDRNDSDSGDKLIPGTFSRKEPGDTIFFGIIDLPGDGIGSDIRYWSKNVRGFSIGEISGLGGQIDFIFKGVFAKLSVEGISNINSSVKSKLSIEVTFKVQSGMSCWAVSNILVVSST